jgi:hypothetical protein
MIDLLPSPSHVGAYRLSGTLDGADYDRCIADIEGRLRLHERIGIYCDMTGFTGLTPEALAKDLRSRSSRTSTMRRWHGLRWWSRCGNSRVGRENRNAVWLVPSFPRRRARASLRRSRTSLAWTYHAFLRP